MASHGVCDKISMKRELEELAHHRFDILVVGGGIQGVMAAWDAALRGLSVALIDRSDFGSATSQNSLKVIHGGLRYLRDGNLSRIRRMVKERAIWMKIAPHLVHPLAFLTPSYQNLTYSRFAMKVALSLNDLISYDRNQLSDREKNIPNGKILTKDEISTILPGLNTAGMTGGSIWYDAQMHSSERLLLSFVISASRAGAVAANYVEATGFLRKGDSLLGVKAKDVISGQTFEIQARVIINCTGAWTDELLEFLESSNLRSYFATSVAVNLVTHQVWQGYAVGLPTLAGSWQNLDGASKHSRLLFIVPWRNFSIIGTWHIPWNDKPDSFEITTAALQEFFEDVNSAYPGLKLNIEDVLHVHCGFLPMVDSGEKGNRFKLLREGRVIDHQFEHGIPELISLVGVKYTTAREVAQEGVDLAIQKLGQKRAACRTHEEPVMGGRIDQFGDFLAQEKIRALGSLDPDIIEHLIYTYGTEYARILEYVKENPQFGERVGEDSTVIKAEVVHAVRCEMAQTLPDVVQRRTELGAAGLPSLSVLHTCSDLVGRELNWSESRKASAIEQVRQVYPIVPEMKRVQG
jgi:glycerol-3-phosphate dehydrogenase